MAYAGKIHKDTIRLAIEKALLKIGSDELEKVQSLLDSKYNYSIDDCLTHPDILKEILHQACGSCYDEILKSILGTLSGSSVDAPIADFIEAMK